jgi:integrase
MARPPLAIGTYGEIWTTPVKTANGKESWRACCRYRHKDGVTRPEERRGPTAAKAKANLKAHLADLQGRSGKALTGASRFREAAELYMQKIELKRRGTTHDTKRSYMKVWVMPALGELRLRECTAGRLNDFFEDLNTATTKRGKPLAPNSRRAIRAIVSGVMQVAVLHEVIAHNPVAELEDIEGGTLKKPTAYDAEQVELFFAEIDADTIAVKSGLNELLRFLFFSGARIGEAYALRWCDVNLSDTAIRVSDPAGGEKELPPRSLWINGNVVRVTGKGLLRHDGKTFKSNRVIAPMSEALYMMLLLRKPITAAEDEPVFPNGKLGWRDPNNTQARIRGLRDRIGFEDFTSHRGRKTVGTGMDRAGFTAVQISDFLGKQSVRDTQETYMGRDLPNPAAAAAIDKMYAPKQVKP